MSDVTDIIKQIAEKVGTTAEAAWPVYCKWVMADGVTDLVTALLMFVVGGLGIWLICRLNRIEMVDDARIPLNIFGPIAVVLLFVFGFAAMKTGLPKVLCPDGFAIHEVVVKVTK